MMMKQWIEGYPLRRQTHISRGNLGTCGIFAHLGSAGLFSMMYMATVAEKKWPPQ